MDDSIRDLFNELTLNAEKDGKKEINESNAHQIIEHLPKLVSEFNSNNPNSVYKSTVIFRKLLSLDINPPIDILINTGIVPRLIQLLSSQELPLLQLEAAWTLTNIASGTLAQTKVVIGNGAVQAFVSLLSSTNDDVKEQAVWALGNIAGDSECRDFLLSQNVLPPLLKVIQDHQSIKLSILRNTTWAIANFCRSKPSPPPIESIRPALPTLAKLIFCFDEEVLVDACWALSYLSDDPDGLNGGIQLVLDSGVCRKISELLSHPSALVQTPALRTIGNLVTGDDIQTQVVLNCGALTHLSVILKSPKKVFRKEACWTISNITAGGFTQIQEVINANVIPLLMGLLVNSEPEVKREATCAISNALSFGKPDQIKYMVDQGIVKSLMILLDEFGPGSNPIIEFALDGIIGILKAGGKESDFNGSVNPYVKLIEGDKIISLQSHPKQGICKKSFEIIENYLLKSEVTHNF